MRTAAVVVDWRRPTETIDALRSLASMIQSPDIMVLVENEGRPEDLAVIERDSPPGVQMIVSPENVGFAGGANLGIDAALEHDVDWVLLLNNDAIALPTCLQRLLEFVEGSANVAVAGPAIAFMDSPEILWFGGGRVNPWLAFTRHRGLMGSSAAPPRSGQTEFVTGCCMLIAADAWKQLGPFRGDFFAYYEDAEWCQRATARGWTCWYLGEVLCLHAVSLSSAQRGSLGLTPYTAYYLARNPLRFALDTQNAARRATRLLGLAIVWNAYNAWRLIQSRNAATLRAYVKGLIDGLRNRMGARPLEGLTN